METSSAILSQWDLYVFTGTGNTLQVARWIQQHAAEAGVPVSITLLPVPSSAGSASVTHGIGLLTPAHGFTATWAMLQFAWSLPVGRGRSAFCAATRAGSRIWGWYLPGFEGTACLLLAVILWLKGYKVLGFAGFDMPSNWTALHAGYRPAAVDALEVRARPHVYRFTDRLLSGQRHYNVIPPLLGLLVAQISLLYLLVGRFVLAKLFYADHRCNGCRRCVKACPFQAIRMVSGRPFWTVSCESCMRCMTECPQLSVQASHPWAVLLCAGSSLPVGVWLSSAWIRMLPGSHLPGWLVTMAGYVWSVVLACVAYLVLHLALRWRPLNRFLTACTPTRWYRRYRNPVLNR